MLCETLNVKWSITPKRLKNNLIINYTMSDNEEITKPTKKRAALSDEKRAELAARMRAINDKRIEDAYNKIQAEKKPAPKNSAEVKTPEPEQKDLGKTETPEIPKKEPKKKKVIQIIQVDSDDEDIEIQMPKKKTAKPAPEPIPEPPQKTRKPRQPKERDDEAILKQKQAPPPQPAPIPQPPIVRCKFL
jgi:hypothetical protein